MLLAYKFRAKQNDRISNLFSISRALYNQMNYQVKQELELNHKWLRYDKLNELARNQEEEYNNYYKLKSQCAQQILRLLEKDWKSYFAAIKNWKIYPENYLGMPRNPHFKNKKLGNLLIFTNQACTIKNNKIYLYCDLYIDIPNYNGKDFTSFRQVRLIPRNNDFMDIEIIYEQSVYDKQLDSSKYCSIDLGINNIISLVPEDNKPILINGKQIKSINQFYNKQISKLQEIRTDNKHYRTIRMQEITDKRNRKIKDLMHKISRFIINYCQKNGIGTIVVGYNLGWKDSIRLGNKNNQTFVSIPYNNLLQMIKYKSELAGITVQETEESYTSKCDSLALETIEKHDNYLGKRKKRGLFQSYVKRLVNADVNGAVNILRKVVDNSSLIKKIINSGLLFRPVRVNNIFLINSFNYCI